METTEMATEEFVTPGGPNVSKNGTIDDEYYIPQLEAARLLVLITFPVIFIIGTIGNVLTFIVMQRGSLKHSSTCFYMAMLAVADTIVLWTDVLRKFIEELTRLEIDIFVWTNCKVGYFLMYFAFNYSSALLVIISFERFLALYFPFKTKTLCTVRIARRVSFVAAILYLAFASQFFLMGKLFVDEYGKYCYYGNVSERYRNILFTTVFPILYSYGPFTLMIICNFAILYKFMKAKFHSQNGGTESTNQALSKSATRGTAMLLTISFAFIILTGPIVVANAVWPNSTIPYFIFRICIAFEYVNHGINGILYCISGTRFRNELKKTICPSKKGANQTVLSRTTTTSVSNIVHRKTTSDHSTSVNPGSH